MTRVPHPTAHQPAAAEQIRAGDVLVLDDGTIGEVTVITPCTVRLPAGGYGDGVALWWAQRGGSQSGVMVRRNSDVLQRAAHPARPGHANGPRREQ